MVFQEMKPEDVRKALEGQVDILGPALKAHQTFFSKLSCYRCGSGVYAFVSPEVPFKEGELLPNYLARCKTCGCEFEPYTQIEVKGPRAT